MKELNLLKNNRDFLLAKISKKDENGLVAPLFRLFI